MTAKTLQHHRVTHPCGAIVEAFIEVTNEGVTQHRIICEKCEDSMTLEAKTPKEDSEEILAWILTHSHQPRQVN